MYINIAKIKFYSHGKRDSFITIMRTAWFQKLYKKARNQEQIMLKTREGRIVRWVIYKSKEDLLKKSKE